MRANIVSPDGGPTIPFALAAGFFRLLSHDVRNGLNAIDLQTAFVAEIATEPEVVEEVKKTRAMSANVSRMLQSTAAYFQPLVPQPITISARLFVEDLRDRVARLFPGNFTEVNWSGTFPDESQQVTLDVELFSAAVGELIRNAFHFREAGREIQVQAAINNGEFQLYLTEGKSKIDGVPEQWGTVPLQSTRRGGYGLGLFHARRIVAVHGGQLSIKFDEERSLLQTVLTIPQEPESTP